MNLEDIATIIGIASIFIAGANFVVIAVVKTFWKLTFERKREDDEKRFTKIESDIRSLRQETDDNEDKNKYFRHNFDSVTKNLQEFITTEIKHLGEIMEIKFKNIFDKFNEKR